MTENNIQDRRFISIRDVGLSARVLNSLCRHDPPIENLFELENYTFQYIKNRIHGLGELSSNQLIKAMKENNVSLKGVPSMDLLDSKEEIKSKEFMKKSSKYTFNKDCGNLKTDISDKFLRYLLSKENGLYGTGLGIPDIIDNEQGNLEEEELYCEFPGFFVNNHVSFLHELGLIELKNEKYYIEVDDSENDQYIKGERMLCIRIPNNLTIKGRIVESIMGDFPNIPIHLISENLERMQSEFINIQLKKEIK